MIMSWSRVPVRGEGHPERAGHERRPDQQEREDSIHGDSPERAEGKAGSR